MSTAYEIAAKLDPARWQQISERLLQRVVLLVESETKPRTPVRTGALQRSVHGELRSVTTGAVGSNLAYAPIVHARRPFLAQGGAAAVSRLDALMQEAGDAFLGGG